MQVAKQYINRQTVHKLSKDDILIGKKYLEAASNWHAMSNSSFSLRWDCWSRPAVKPYSGAGALSNLTTSNEPNFNELAIIESDSPLGATLTTR